MKQSTSASRLTRLILAAIFSQRVCTAVIAALSIVSFLLITTGHPRIGAAVIGFMLPWFVTGLRNVGE